MTHIPQKQVARQSPVPPSEEQKNEHDPCRQVMKQYWELNTGNNPTIDEMMLMYDAQEMHQAEHREILQLLPEFKNRSVLELGCGIGRFTGILADKAQSVTSVDFIQSCIEKNKETNGRKYDNITFRCEDVTRLKMKGGGFDMVFSNWLMMYLNDKEVEKLAIDMAEWCKPGGYIFFRESCHGGPSGDKPRAMNPTFYRRHLHYTNLFSRMENLELLQLARVRCYEEMKNKTNQYVWVFRKQR